MIESREPSFRPLRAFADGRGWSHFNIFGEVTSGQINVGNVYPNVVKAFHYHNLQEDNWHCISGDIHVIVFNIDNVKDVRHYYIGENNPGVLNIPRGWAHGYKNLGVTNSSLLYWVTKSYDPKQVDEYRLSWDFLGKDIWEIENK